MTASKSWVLWQITTEIIIIGSVKASKYYITFCRRFLNRVYFISSTISKYWTENCWQNNRRRIRHFKNALILIVLFVYWFRITPLKQTPLSGMDHYLQINCTVTQTQHSPSWARTKLLLRHVHRDTNMPTDKIDTPDFRCNESVRLLTFEAFNRMYPEFRRYSFNSDSYQSLFEYFVFLSHSACLQLSCPKSWPRAVPQEIHGDISFHQHATTMSQCFQNKIFTASSNWGLSGPQELRD